MNDTRPTDGRTWRRPLVALAAACAVGTVVLSGCGSSSTDAGATSADAGAATSSPAATSTGAAAPGSSAGSTSSPAGPVTIMISGFRYDVPGPVQPGATVSVMNMDEQAHTVTSDQDGAFDVPVAPGTTVTFTVPSTPGSYDFHCTYHANMHGTLVVQ